MFFAGWKNLYDTVSGGTGTTPEEALEDYLAEHAEYEIDYSGIAPEDQFYVEIYSTITKQQAIARGIASDDPWHDKWSFMLDELIEKRTIAVRFRDGAYSFTDITTRQKEHKK